MIPPLGDEGSRAGHEGARVTRTLRLVGAATLSWAAVAHPAGAPGYMMVRDAEFESLADLEAWLEQRFADPETVRDTKWQEYHESLDASTLWNLIE